MAKDSVVVLRSAQSRGGNHGCKRRVECLHHLECSFCLKCVEAIHLDRIMAVDLFQVPDL
jgi:hypothetical protein